MLQQHLISHHIILASGSPRRQQFLNDLGIDFEIRLKEVEEVYPKKLKGAEISDYLAKLKASVFLEELKPKDILITSDTVVWHEGNALGKPKSQEEAFSMLQSMSGKSHEVITSVCFSTTTTQKVVHDITTVYFDKMTAEEIHYYIKNYKPFDKAGAYGIQEWIGNTKVLKIEGSYANVVGLPTHLVYKTLIELTS